MFEGVGRGSCGVRVPNFIAGIEVLGKGILLIAVDCLLVSD